MKHPNLEQLVDLVGEANENPEDPSTNRLLTAQKIWKLGFLMVGTAESQQVRQPTKQIYLDRNFLDEEGKPSEFSFFEDPETTFIRATWSGKLAIQNAVLGDINIRGQRELLGRPLTRTPKQYGWECRSIVFADRFDLPELSEDLLFPHAEQALLNAVNDDVEGCIDVVSLHQFGDVFNRWHDPETGKAERVHAQPGMMFAYEDVETIATLTVRGSDLWYTDINSREYDKKTARS